MSCIYILVEGCVNKNAKCSKEAIHRLSNAVNTYCSALKDVTNVTFVPRPMLIISLEFYFLCVPLQ